MGNKNKLWCVVVLNHTSGGISIIARDHLGNICGGQHNSVRGGSIKKLEAKTILEGIRLAEEEWQNIIVELDVETTVINHLKNINFIWRIDTIMTNVLVLANSISNVTWEVIFRIANFSVHWIIKHAKYSVFPSYWISQPHPIFSSCYFRFFYVTWLCFIYWNEF